MKGILYGDGGEREGETVLTMCLSRGWACPRARLSIISRDLHERFVAVFVTMSFKAGIWGANPWWWRKVNVIKAKKDVAQIFNNLLRRQIGSRSPTVEYLSTKTDIFVVLIDGYWNWAVDVHLSQVNTFIWSPLQPSVPFNSSCLDMKIKKLRWIAAWCCVSVCVTKHWRELLCGRTSRIISTASLYSSNCPHLILRQMRLPPLKNSWRVTKPWLQSFWIRITISFLKSTLPFSTAQIT